MAFVWSFQRWEEVDLSMVMVMREEEEGHKTENELTSPLVPPPATSYSSPSQTQSSNTCPRTIPRSDTSNCTLRSLHRNKLQCWDNSQHPCQTIYARDIPSPGRRHSQVGLALCPTAIGGQVRSGSEVCVGLGCGKRRTGRSRARLLFPEHR